MIGTCVMRACVCRTIDTTLVEVVDDTLLLIELWQSMHAWGALGLNRMAACQDQRTRAPYKLELLVTHRDETTHGGITISFNGQLAPNNSISTLKTELVYSK